MLLFTNLKLNFNSFLRNTSRIQIFEYIFEVIHFIDFKYLALISYLGVNSS